MIDIRIGGRKNETKENKTGTRRTARDIMHPRVSLHAKDTGEDIAKTFVKQNVTLLPVVDRGKLEGIIRRTNAINSPAEKGFWPGSNQRPKHSWRRRGTNFCRRFSWPIPDALPAATTGSAREDTCVREGRPAIVYSSGQSRKSEVDHGDR